MDKPTTSRITKRSRKPRGPKLPSLPADAAITKRPLLRPAIPSPHAGATSQKVVYISHKTPFLSAVKRVEKLLHLSDKRLVQSATQLSKDASYRKRKWEREDDEVLGIAREVEELKRSGRKRSKAGADSGEPRSEEVVLKATGKAIAKGLELGLWFQQREEYVVRLETGSVSAVDDVTYLHGGGEEAESAEQDVMVGDKAVQKGNAGTPASRIVKREEAGLADGTTEIAETRIRQLSVLEVYVGLR